MKFRIKKRIKKDKTLWHKWFAWFPVKIQEDSEISTFAWLQTVERKGEVQNPIGKWIFLYKLCDDENDKWIKICESNKFQI